MAPPLPFTFIAGETGPWLIESVEPYLGDPLPHAARLRVETGHVQPEAARWALRGTTGGVRYTHRPEKAELHARPAPLARPAATRASFIPIRKTDAWWDLTQEERRAIFEEQSRHIAASLPYLPAIARRLHHARELGEPFDFLTWFEYAPEDAGRFDELLALLRATAEWTYVERECHVRLRAG